MCSATQARTFGLMNDGHSRFIAADRHPGAGNAEGEPRLARGIVEAAGDREAEIRVADLALLDVDALLVGIDAQADRMRLSTSASGSRGDGCEHDGAAGDLERPAGAALARRRELRQQRDAVAARE